MTDKRVLSTLLALSISFLAPHMVKAQSAQAPSAPQSPFALYEAAGATSDQMTQIRTLAEAFNQAQKVRYGAVVALLQDLHNLSLQPDLDEKTALDKQDQINRATAEMGTEKIRLMVKIRSVLTADQRKKLVSILKTTDPTRTSSTTDN